MTDPEPLNPLEPLSPSESTKKFYNDHVNEYIANIHKAGVTHAPTQHAKSFVQYMQEFFVQSSFKVLELGCGYGRDAEFFAANHIHLIATDYSRSMLLKAQERLEQSANESNDNIHWMEMDMRQIGQLFLPNSLHGIWACASLLHLPKQDLPELLQNIYQVLKPGGIVYVSVKVHMQNDTTNGEINNSPDQGETFDPDERYGGIRKFYAFYQEEEFLKHFRDQNFILVDSGVADHRNQDAYATHPFLHVFARKPAISL